MRAWQTWPYYGVPKNPAAWLMQTAKNLALDGLRREKVFREKEPQIVATIESRMAGSEEETAPQFEDEIRDGRLRLIFACCHPGLPPEAQTALALKTLCGFSPAEIAQAFLTSEAAIAKRLTRARQRIQEQGIPFAIPAGAELGTRLDGVLQVLYLLFSEGYKASGGESLVRADLCYEAIRLGLSLAEHPLTRQPRTHALLALMLLDAARLPARMDSDGRMRRLQEQDRTLWDQALIARGIYYLGLAAAGAEVTAYHLQAGIAACHALAPSYGDTDWSAILTHYDRWAALDDSPLVALNRAVAVAEVEGPAAGRAAVAAMPKLEQLETYYLRYAVLGDFAERLGENEIAAGHFAHALRLAAVPSERAYLQQRLHHLHPNSP